jgi:hypothetical protein
MNVVRIAHLLGGLKAINNPDLEVFITPNTINNKIVKFNLKNYDAFLSTLKTLKLNVVGIDLYSTKKQVEGIYPPEWHSLGRIESLNYPFNDLMTAWGNLSTSAHLQGDYSLANICGNISFQFKACESRLRDISSCYHRELFAICESGDFQNGKRMKSINTFNIYLAIHSFFDESCSLRNYFAEFIGFYVFPNYRDLKLSSMGSLRKKVLNKEHKDNPFANELYKITDPDSIDGWLAKLGEYRDLIRHYLPLGEMSSTSFLVHQLTGIANKQCLPSIKLPLPDNPGDISKKQHQGFTFSNYDEWFKAFQRDFENSQNLIDALEYCCFIYNKLIKLATKLINYAPLKPEILVIRPEDIQGEIVGIID